MNTFTFKHSGTTVTLNKIEKIKLGNDSDNAGQYRGDLVDCEILQVEEKQFSINVLARPVNNKNFIVCATYVPHMVEHERIEVPLYSTNARVIGQFGFVTLEECAKSMGFDVEDLILSRPAKPFVIVFADGTEIEEMGTDEHDVREFLGRSYKGIEVKSVQEKQL